MLTQTTHASQTPSRVRRNHRTAAEPGLVTDRRHAMLVVAHRLVRPMLRPEWLRWLEQKAAPGQKVY